MAQPVKKINSGSKPKSKTAKKRLNHRLFFNQFMRL